MTLALGLASVSFFNSLDDYLTEIPVDLPKVKFGSPIFVFPREHRKMRLGGGAGGGSSKTTFDINDKNAFVLTGHGCGGRDIYGGEGSASGYRSYDGQTLSTDIAGYGSVKNAKRVMNQRLHEASTVLEFITIFDKKTITRKRRAVLEFDSEKKIIRISTYDGSNSISTINAPTLKLALEFEKWEELQNLN